MVVFAGETVFGLPKRSQVFRVRVSSSDELSGLEQGIDRSGLFVESEFDDVSDVDPPLLLPQLSS